MASVRIPAASGTWIGRLGWTLRDGWTLTCREFGHLRRKPGELLTAVVVPGLMVLLFGYVFGSAIGVPGGGNYREYLLPGLFAMVAASGVLVSTTQIAHDVDAGVMDRFRSMPMARLAVPFGRTTGDLFAAIPGMVIMVLIGLLVGWRAHGSWAETAAAFGLIVLLRYALSWAGVVLGLSVSARAAEDMVPLIFPVLMLSNAFVPTEGMTPWLRAIADWNPISALVAACRELFGNPGAAQAHASLPLQHPILVTLGWSLALLVIFVPLATWRFHKAGR
ncbi:ABC transporter permease [Flindersiella endophytica]